LTGSEGVMEGLVVEGTMLLPSNEKKTLQQDVDLRPLYNVFPVAAPWRG
jgi:hypothetical protein